VVHRALIASFVHLEGPRTLRADHQSVEEGSDTAREEEVVQAVQAYEEGSQRKQEGMLEGYG
jgi:hypothetical protein